MNMNNNYIIKNNNISYLKSLGFRHIGDGIYERQFPVYKWRGFVTIIGKFTAFDDSNKILINVYQEDGSPYAPYYSNDKNSDVLNIIKKNIQNELKKCFISIKEGV